MWSGGYFLFHTLGGRIIIYQVMSLKISKHFSTCALIENLADSLLLASIKLRTIIDSNGVSIIITLKQEQPLLTE